MVKRVLGKGDNKNPESNRGRDTDPITKWSILDTILMMKKFEDFIHQLAGELHKYPDELKAIIVAWYNPEASAEDVENKLKEPSSCVVRVQTGEDSIERSLFPIDHGPSHVRDLFTKIKDATRGNYRLER